MSVNGLHQFKALLKANHELSRIQAETDPLLEGAAVSDRVCKSAGGGPALQWLYHQSAIISLENPRPGMVSETAAPHKTLLLRVAHRRHEYGLD